jgi:hypothetical protein
MKKTTTAALVLLFLASAIVAVLASRSAVFAWQMVGSFAGLCALAILGRPLAASYPWLHGRLTLRGRRIDLAEAGRRTWPALLVVGVAVAVVAPLLLGQMPLSHDHPVHLYKAWHFWDEMLLQGRLRGWSSYWFFGYPAEELYPIGPDLWVAAFRLATLGMGSWEATYGLAFVAVFAFAAYSLYAFGRRHFGRTAGVVAGLIWVLDAGDYREGGWSYTVDWAVWVQVLANAFALLALGRLADVLDRGRPRDYAIAALLFGAALLSHPMNVMVLGLALPLYLVARSLAEGKPLGAELARTAGALGLGIAIAGFWFLPMTTRSAWTTNIGDLWRPLAQTVKGLLEGSVFANVWPVIALLGLVGGVLGVAMRRAVPIFLLCLAALLLFLASATAFEELSLMALSKSFAKIQYQRLTIPAKTALFLLAGLAVQELAARVAAWRRERAAVPAEGAAPPAQPGLLRRGLLVVLVAAVAAPFVRPALQELHHSYLKTIGGLSLKRSIPYWNDYQEFLRWSAQARARSEGFYRISYELDRHNHLMMGAPAFNRTPYYKVGYTPARLFKHVVETTEEPLYKILSVKYVVSLGPLFRPNLVEEIRFGSIFVYRYKDYRKERYTLSGPGSVEVKEFSEEKIHLTLRGTSPSSRLKVHVANYARWRARLNGEVVPISEAPVYGTTYPMLMEVAAKDGELVLDYVSRPVDWIGALATLFGLGGVVVLVLAGRRSALAERLSARLSPLGRLALRLAGPATALLALAGVALGAYRIAKGGAGLEEGSLASRLGSAEVSQAGRPCRERKSGRWYCTGRSWNYVGPTAEKFNGAYLPCIWAHPVDEGPLTIRFPKLRLGRALKGGHGIADGAVEGFVGGAPVTLDVQIDGRRVESLTRPNEKGWAGFRVATPEWSGKEAELTLSVSTRSSGGRHYCFDVKVEP